MRERTAIPLGTFCGEEELVPELSSISMSWFFSACSSRLTSVRASSIRSDSISTWNSKCACRKRYVSDGKKGGVNDFANKYYMEGSSAIDNFPHPLAGNIFYGETEPLVCGA